MDAPVSVRQPMFFVPKAVLFLLIVMIAVHVGRTYILSADANTEFMIRFAFLPMRYLPGIDGGAWWEKVIPFVSHQFLHSGWLHLTMNGAWLVACGAVVARRFGPWLFLGFFLICGIVGAAVFLAWVMIVSGGVGINGMIGASGAVAGLMAASIRMMPNRSVFAIWSRAPLLPLATRSVVAFTVIWFATNLIYAEVGFGPVHQIAWQAHIGGYLAGLFLTDLFDFFARRLTRG